MTVHFVCNSALFTLLGISHLITVYALKNVDLYLKSVAIAQNFNGILKLILMHQYYTLKSTLSSWSCYVHYVSQPMLFLCVPPDKTLHINCSRVIL